jgi:hypothetical protein
VSGGVRLESVGVWEAVGSPQGLGCGVRSQRGCMCREQQQQCSGRSLCGLLFGDGFWRSRPLHECSSSATSLCACARKQLLPTYNPRLFKTPADQRTVSCAVCLPVCSPPTHLLSHTGCRAYEPRFGTEDSPIMVPSLLSE